MLEYYSYGKSAEGKRQVERPKYKRPQSEEKIRSSETNRKRSLGHQGLRVRTKLFVLIVKIIFDLDTLNLDQLKNLQSKTTSLNLSNSI